MLDRETDTKLRSSIHDTLTSMLQELAAGELARWLSLCKVVLSASTGTSICNVISFKKDRGMYLSLGKFHQILSNMEDFWSFIEQHCSVANLEKENIFKVLYLRHIIYDL